MKTLIDVTLTNKVTVDKILNYRILPENISDHDLIVFNFKVGTVPVHERCGKLVPKFNKKEQRELYLQL